VILREILGVHSWFIFFYHKVHEVITKEHKVTIQKKHTNLIINLLHTIFVFLKFLSRQLIILLIIFCIIPPPFSSAQVIPESNYKTEINSTLQARGEVYIAVPLSRHKSALLLSTHFSLGKIQNDTAYFFITGKDTSLLYSSGISFSVEPAPSLKAPVTMASSIPEVLQGLAYPTYSQYLTIMDSIRDTYPLMVFIDTIGYSINNRLILAARIQTDIHPQEEKPVVFLSSTMHGNEVPGYVILLMLMDELTQLYNSSAEIKNLLDEVILIINPLANPDGTYFYSDTTVYGSRRTNLNDVDLNRNFPDAYKGWEYGDPRQPENIAMMGYMDKFRPSLSANLHAGAEVVNYPWDWGIKLGSGIANLHPDNEWFRLISAEYADAARDGHPDYMNLFPGGISNGAYWYVIYGGRQDYVTAFLQGREITLEISNEFIPPASDLSWFYERNRNALINYIKQATYGLHGKVTDNVTGEPVGKVKISLPDHDTYLSYIYSDSITGTFRRYVRGGNYQVIFSKEGYSDYTANVNILDYERIDLDIKLIANPLTCYPNPFTGELRVRFSSAVTGSAKVEIFTITGQVAYSANFSIIKGINILYLEPGVPAGMNIIKITTEEGTWKKRIVKVE